MPNLGIKFHVSKPQKEEATIVYSHDATFRLALPWYLRGLLSQYTRHQLLKRTVAVRMLYSLH